MNESFNHKSSDILIPDGSPINDALSRTSHLAIGAHSDDLEIMAYHGIVNCYGHGEQLNKNWFTGVTATDGEEVNGPDPIQIAVMRKWRKFVKKSRNKLL